MSDWKPIMTAPKDGTTVIVSDGKTVECAEWGGMGEWFASTGTHRVWEGGDSTGGLAWPDCAPTHWMPLPEPPK